MHRREQRPHHHRRDGSRGRPRNIFRNNRPNVDRGRLYRQLYRRGNGMEYNDEFDRRYLTHRQRERIVEFGEVREKSFRSHNETLMINSEEKMRITTLSVSSRKCEKQLPLSQSNTNDISSSATGLQDIPLPDERIANNSQIKSNQTTQNNAQEKSVAKNNHPIHESLPVFNMSDLPQQHLNQCKESVSSQSSLVEPYQPIIHNMAESVIKNLEICRTMPAQTNEQYGSHQHGNRGLQDNKSGTLVDKFNMKLRDTDLRQFPDNVYEKKQSNQISGLGQRMLPPQVNRDFRRDVSDFGQALKLRGLTSLARDLRPLSSKDGPLLPLKFTVPPPPPPPPPPKLVCNLSHFDTARLSHSDAAQAPNSDTAKISYCGSAQPPYLSTAQLSPSDSARAPFFNTALVLDSKSANNIGSVLSQQRTNIDCSQVWSNDHNVRVHNKYLQNRQSFQWPLHENPPSGCTQTDCKEILYRRPDKANLAFLENSSRDLLQKKSEDDINLCHKREQRPQIYEQYDVPMIYSQPRMCPSVQLVSSSQQICGTDKQPTMASLETIVPNQTSIRTGCIPFHNNTSNEILSSWQQEWLSGSRTQEMSLEQEMLLEHNSSPLAKFENQHQFPTSTFNMEVNKRDDQISSRSNTLEKYFPQKNLQEHCGFSCNEIYPNVNQQSYFPTREPNARFIPDNISPSLPNYMDGSRRHCHSRYMNSERSASHRDSWSVDRSHRKNWRDEYNPGSHEPYRRQFRRDVYSFPTLLSENNKSYSESNARKNNWLPSEENARMENNWSHSERNDRNENNWLHSERNDRNDNNWLHSEKNDRNENNWLHSEKNARMENNWSHLARNARKENNWSHLEYNGRKEHRNNTTVNEYRDRPDGRCRQYYNDRNVCLPINHNDSGLEPYRFIQQQVGPLRNIHCQSFSPKVTCSGLRKFSEDFPIPQMPCTYYQAAFEDQTQKNNQNEERLMSKQCQIMLDQFHPNFTVFGNKPLKDAHLNRDAIDTQIKMNIDEKSIADKSIQKMEKDKSLEFSNTDQRVMRNNNLNFYDVRMQGKTCKETCEKRDSNMHMQNKTQGAFNLLRYPSSPNSCKDSTTRDREGNMVRDFFNLGLIIDNKNTDKCIAAPMPDSTTENLEHKFMDIEMKKPNYEHCSDDFVSSETTWKLLPKAKSQVDLEFKTTNHENISAIRVPDDKQRKPLKESPKLTNLPEKHRKGKIPPNPDKVGNNILSNESNSKDNTSHASGCENSTQSSKTNYRQTVEKIWSNIDNVYSNPLKEKKYLSLKEVIKPHPKMRHKQSVSIVDMNKASNILDVKSKPQGQCKKSVNTCEAERQLQSHSTESSKYSHGGRRGREDEKRKESIKSRQPSTHRSKGGDKKAEQNSKKSVKDLKVVLKNCKQNLSDIGTMRIQKEKDKSRLELSYTKANSDVTSIKVDKDQLKNKHRYSSKNKKSQTNSAQISKTRGKYFLSTPNTLEIVKPAKSRRSIKLCEPQSEALLRACQTAKKDLIYRSVAVELLSRDKTKPLVEKKPKGKRVTGITKDKIQKKLEDLVQPTDRDVGNDKMTKEKCRYDVSKGEMKKINRYEKVKDLVLLDEPSADYKMRKTGFDLMHIPVNEQLPSESKENNFELKKKLAPSVATASYEDVIIDVEAFSSSHESDDNDSAVEKLILCTLHIEDDGEITNKNEKRDINIDKEATTVAECKETDNTNKAFTQEADMNINVDSDKIKCSCSVGTGTDTAPSADRIVIDDEHDKHPSEFESGTTSIVNTLKKYHAVITKEEADMNVIFDNSKVEPKKKSDFSTEDAIARFKPDGQSYDEKKIPENKMGDMKDNMPSLVPASSDNGFELANASQEPPKLNLDFSSTYLVSSMDQSVPSTSTGYAGTGKYSPTFEDFFLYRQSQMRRLQAEAQNEKWTSCESQVPCGNTDLPGSLSDDPFSIDVERSFYDNDYTITDTDSYRRQFPFADSSEEIFLAMPMNKIEYENSYQLFDEPEEDIKVDQDDDKANMECLYEDIFVPSSIVPANSETEFGEHMLNKDVEITSGKDYEDRNDGEKTVISKDIDAEMKHVSHEKELNVKIAHEDQNQPTVVIDAQNRPTIDAGWNRPTNGVEDQHQPTVQVEDQNQQTFDQEAQTKPTFDEEDQNKPIVIVKDQILPSVNEKTIIVDNVESSAIFSGQNENQIQDTSEQDAATVINAEQQPGPTKRWRQKLISGLAKTGPITRSQNSKKKIIHVNLENDQIAPEKGSDAVTQEKLDAAIVKGSMIPSPYMPYSSETYRMDSVDLDELDQRNS